MAIDKMLNIYNWVEKLHRIPAFLLELNPYELNELLSLCKEEKQDAEQLALSTIPKLRPQQVSTWTNASFVEQKVLAEMGRRIREKASNTIPVQPIKVFESFDETALTRLKELPPPEALAILKSVMTRPNSALLLLSRWNKNEFRQREGTIDFQEYKLEHNQIVKAIQEFIDELSFDELERLEAYDLGKRMHKSMAVQPTSPRPRKTTKKKIILVLSADPSGTAKLRLTEEYGRIQREMEGCRKFSVISKDQVNWQDINLAVTAKANRTRLYIVHFSGHGQESDPQYVAMLRELGLSDQDDIGVIVYDADKHQPKNIVASVWTDFFTSVKGITCPELQIVVFNNCFSESIAQAVSKTGLYVVGVKNRVKEKAAQQFSSGFYMALCEDETIENSVRAGIRQARAEGLEKMEDIALFFQGNHITLQ